eukprot:scaffold12877_cov84-Cylindrotheca_fusiformis.AAC.3
MNNNSCFRLTEKGRLQLFFFCLLVCSNVMDVTNGFAFSSSTNPTRMIRPTLAVMPNLLLRDSNSQKHSVRMFLVSEEDVLEAVEEAEKRWAEALEARKNANALSDRAEEEAEAASDKAKEVEEKMKDKTKKISVKTLAEGDAVARSNLDASSMVNKALEAAEEADRLLEEAETALEKSEQTLDQHLKDFPDSPLAQ